MQTSLGQRRLVRASALYDIAMTTPFATPWSATFVLGLLGTLHRQLGLPGAGLPAFESMHLFFVGLLGTVVTAWSIVRLVRPEAWLGRIDGMTRIGFSLWMAWALLDGQSPLLAGFFGIELAFG
ncbi:MAG TPA: hypothetical protein VLC09_12795, partial [Polyangiaceae bacterium]|nr:hypothetical protein [Polyangiaceae bacterium]